MISALILAARLLAAPVDPNWMQHARIGGYGLEDDNADSIVRDALATGVNAIEVDNDPTGRYESLLDPTAKLKALRAVAQAAHAAGLPVFAYAAGLECITGDASHKAHTLLKDHPDWLQRDRQGNPAVFGGGTAFWIEPGDEDVWVTPFAPDWRKLYLERIGQMAATGIDAVYVDIPYWMSHFDGWEHRWPSFDAATVAEFKRRTGLDAVHGVKLDDWKDPGFLAWTKFRVDAITKFMRDVRAAVKAANPSCAAVAEIYPGYDENALGTGADVTRLYDVLDGITHEFEVGDGHAATWTEAQWFEYLAGLLAYRGFAGAKAAWALSYSWEGEKWTLPGDPMRTLLLTEAAAGIGCWDTSRHIMSESNDPSTRTEVFRWLARHEDRFYGAIQPLAPVGLLFDPVRRDADPDGYADRFRSALVRLLRAHVDVRVVTPASRSAVGKADVFDPLAGLPETFPRAAVDASPQVAAIYGRVGGEAQVILLNFGGLRPGVGAKPVPERGIRIRLPSLDRARIMAMPFQGEPVELKSTFRNGVREATLPVLERGAVVWAQGLE